MKPIEPASLLVKSPCEITVKVSSIENVPLDMIAISETSMTLLSPIELPDDLVLSVSNGLFGRIGIESPRARDSASTKSATLGWSSTVRAELVKMPAADLQLLKLWLIRNLAP